MITHTVCLACLFSTVSSCHNNLLGRESTGCRQITKLEQSTSLRYLWQIPQTSHLKNRLINAHTNCLACLFSTVSSCHNNPLGRASTGSRHKMKLEQSTFLRYLWQIPQISHLKNRLINAHTNCLACLFSTVSSCHNNPLGRASTGSRHKMKLEQSTFLRYLW